MKCNQSRPGFELVSPCPFPTTITITPRARFYIYSRPQKDCFIVSQLFSVARHARCFKFESKPAQLYVRLSILPLSYKATYVSSGIIMHYVLAFICLNFCATGYQSAQFVRRALHYASGSRWFLRQSAQPPGGERIYCHLQTVCFVASQIHIFGLHFFVEAYLIKLYRQFYVYIFVFIFRVAVSIFWYQAAIG